MNNNESLDLIVVGLNFSGLSCAKTLASAGHHVTVIGTEEDRNFWKTSSVEFQGELVDLNPQVFYESQLGFHSFLYNLDLFLKWKREPRILHFLKEKSLRKFSFNPSMFLFSGFGVYERFLFAKDCLKHERTPRQEIMDLGIDVDANLYLLEAGYRQETIDSFFKPFIASFTGEKNLKSTSRRPVQNLLKNWMSEHLLISEEGYQGIFDKAVSKLSNFGINIITNSVCKSLRSHPIDPNNYILGIQTDHPTEQFINADRVILCSSAPVASCMIYPFDQKTSKILGKFKKLAAWKKLCFEVTENSNYVHQIILNSNPNAPFDSVYFFQKGSKTFASINVTSEQAEPAYIKQALESSFEQLAGKLIFVGEQSVDPEAYHQPVDFRVDCPSPPITNIKNLFLGGRFLTDSSLEGSIEAGNLGARECLEAKIIPPSQYARGFASTSTGA